MQLYCTAPLANIDVRDTKKVLKISYSNVICPFGIKKSVMGRFPEFKWAEDDSLPNKKCLNKEQVTGEVNPAERTWSIL